MKLIILDRDGVINFDSINYIKSPDEWIAVPNSLQAIARLNQAGYTISVASNQSGVARGLYTEQVLADIHDKMQNELKAVGGYIDSIFYCAHLPSEGCDCRKPKPGLLHQIAKNYQVDLKGIPFIGDRATDVLTASKVGAKAVLVASGYRDETERLAKINYPYDAYQSLSDAVTALLAGSND